MSQLLLNIAKSPKYINLYQKKQKRFNGLNQVEIAF